MINYLNYRDYRNERRAMHTANVLQFWYTRGNSWWSLMNGGVHGAEQGGNWYVSMDRECKSGERISLRPWMMNNDVSGTAEGWDLN